MTDDGNGFVYTAADFLGWALKSGWQPGVLPIGVVYTFQGPVARALAGQPDRFVENSDLVVSNAKTFMTVDEGPPVAVMCLNPGAVSMVTQLEHLRLLFGDMSLDAIIVGTAGAIAGPHRIGDTVVVSSALRTDGISDKYLPPSPSVAADRGLTKRLATHLGPVPTAMTWTVPVPYRSTRRDLEWARAAGAQLVDMEIAALYAAGAALAVRTAAAVVVSDVHRVDEPVSVDWSDTLGPTVEVIDAAISTIRDDPPDT